MKAVSFVIVTTAIVSMFFQSAHAQWSLNGMKVFYNAGNVGIGTNNPAYTLEVRSAGLRAIYGTATAATGVTHGFYGQSASTTGKGVFGLASATTGVNYGVQGQSSSTTGKGVSGVASAATGANYGVQGQSASTGGRGVYGLASAATGTTYGVFGQVISTSGFAGYFTGGKNYFQGFVGIGTTIPSQPLHVVGNLKVTGWIGNDTTDPVDIRSNERRGLRIADAVNGDGEISPNLIGGVAGNSVGVGVNGSTIGGGGEAVLGFNGITDNYGTIGGGVNNQAGDAAGTVSDKRFATVGGGIANSASGQSSTVGGGENNSASGNRCTVGGGQLNTASGIGGSTVGGGQSNIASSLLSTVSGGGSNTANDESATVGGGGNNTASGENSTVGGGGDNTASGDDSTVSGGHGNTASGSSSTVPGGQFNAAAGQFSFAGGRRAKANHSGAFVWGDSTFADITSSTSDEMTFRSVGGVRIFTNTALNAGVTLAAAGSAWASVSDRNMKENFAVVDSREVVKKLAAMPMETWNYKAQDKSIRHIGPMAQDFAAAFGVGEDDKHITTIDADGVALAAIQGLHQLLKEKEAEIATLRAEKDAQIRMLGERLAKIEATLGTTSKP